MPLPDPENIDIDRFLKKGVTLNDDAKLLLLLENDTQIVEFLKRRGGSIPLDNEGRWLIKCPCLNREAFCGLKPEPAPDGTMKLTCSTPLYKEKKLSDLVFNLSYFTDQCPYSRKRFEHMLHDQNYR